MKIRRRRPLATLATVVGAGVLLGACGTSSPPGREVAEEMIETLEVSQDVKDCMFAAVDDFSLTEEEAKGFDGLDDVAEKADEGQEQAKQIMARFQDSLAACNR